ncbi:MAG: PadR family transcriptional regulator [Mycoplasmatales bacterium]
MNQQFKKGIIEICVLHFIKKEDRYGYEIVKELGVLFDVKESTIYPILKRLSNDKYLETYLVESNSGPARKYYKITKMGYENYEDVKKEWLKFAQGISQYLNEGEIWKRIF